MKISTILDYIDSSHMALPWFSVVAAGAARFAVVACE